MFTRGDVPVRVLTCVPPHPVPPSRVQVYQLWAVDSLTGTRAVACMVTGCLFLLGPILAVLCGTLRRPAGWDCGDTVADRRSAGHLVGGALVAPFRGCAPWFGAVLLADRLVYAGVVVAAQAQPVLQLLLVSGSGVLVCVSVCGSVCVSVCVCVSV